MSDGFGNVSDTSLYGTCLYPVSGLVRDYRAPGYIADHPLVPHGISVILNAPAVFRYTAQTSHGRHLLAAQALGADIDRAKSADAGEILVDQIVRMMHDLRMPNGLRAAGLCVVRHPGTRGRNLAAASRDEALSALCGARRTRALVRRRDDDLVRDSNPILQRETMTYKIVQFADLPTLPCPCGTTQRAFGDVDEYPGTIHLTRISEDAQLHYPQARLTETVLLPRMRSGRTAMQLNDETVPVTVGIVCR